MLDTLSKIGKKIRIVGFGRAAKVVFNRFRKRGQKVYNYPQSYLLGPSKPLGWLKDPNITSLYITPEKGPFAWHEGYEAEVKVYYKNIAIKYGQGPQLGPDIKTAWDRSRFVYAPSMQPDCFERIVTDWLAHNPHLFGINWLCPMEVAIRAINFIIAFSLFQHKLSSNFLKKLIASLYEHLIFLESNWELADGRTSNHYLADLVGYLYVSWFFDDTKKQSWVINEIEKEMAWQIFDEGTSYEGSAAYHELVTELFVHADLMARECGKKFSKKFYEKLEKMQEFVAWCDGIKIGDDDSGRITSYHVLSPHKVSGAKTFVQFGLSIIKTDTWHITLRHAAYHPRQPSGHFHDDAGSITLAYNGISILVDLGSYIYTPSAYWRDHFRSAQVHNKLYTKNSDKIIDQSDMFTLNLPQAECDKSVVETESKYMIETSYILDPIHARRALKKLECDVLINSIKISDIVEGGLDQDFFSNLTFAPGISVKKNKQGWLIAHEGKSILKMHTDFMYEEYGAWVAPKYGTKIKTVGLRSRVQLKKTITLFSVIGD